ncbi:hypothetical protein KK120_09965 [Virgibacillus dakarensis]|nr:hypothetical protein [Virgibacillus dakarensis]
MKKYIPVFICIMLAFILLCTTIRSSPSKPINSYPNLPAPIGGEKILITSAGQAAEGTILLKIAENLNLEADYRPRALATDLYDYASVVIVLGYSANGIAHTPRSFAEELTRTDQLVEEAEHMNLPVVLVDLSGKQRENDETEKLFTRIIPFADYYIGLKNVKHPDKLLTTLKKHHVPATLVTRLDDLSTPFNSAFR